MTTVAAELNVVVKANTKALDTGLTKASRGLGKFATTTGRTLQSVGTKLAVGVSAPLIGLGTAATMAAIEWESAFAGVQKTVSGTTDELAAIETGLKNLATNSPVASLANAHTELAQIAETAGQLGIKTEDILAFTETMAGLSVATNLTSEGAATFAARFANVTGMDMSNIGDLANVIVTLGNNMAATESDITTFANRLSNLATFNWSVPQILGMSAAMASLGISAELGSTNLIKTVTDLTTAVSLNTPELQTWAGVAGTTVTEFKALAEQDPAGAFDAFLAGLSELETSDALQVLNDLGISSTEQQGVMLKLATGYDTVTKAVDMANDSWSDSNALMTEVETKAGTTDGKIQAFKNNLNGLAITVGEALLPALNDIIEGLTPLIQKLSEAPPEFIALGIVVAGALIALAPMVTTLGLIASGIGLILSPLGILVTLLGAGLILGFDQFSEGLQLIADGFKQLTEGNILDGLLKLRVGLAAIVLAPVKGLADGVLILIENITGLELPDVETGLMGWVDAFRYAGEAIGIIWENTIRKIEMAFQDLKLEALKAVMTLEEANPLGSVSNATIQATTEAAQTKLNMGAAWEVEDTLREQLAGQKIDLSEMIEVDVGGMIKAFSISDALSAEGVLENLGSGAAGLISQAINTALTAGDAGTVTELLITAENLGITLDADIAAEITTLLDEAGGQVIDYYVDMPTEVTATTDPARFTNALVGQLPTSIDHTVTANVTMNTNVVGGAPGAATDMFTPGGNIPRHHDGGIFRNPAGEGLAWLKDGERVLTPQQTAAYDRGGNGSVNITVSAFGADGYSMAQAIARERAKAGG